MSASWSNNERVDFGSPSPQNTTADPDSSESLDPCTLIRFSISVSMGNVDIAALPQVLIRQTIGMVPGRVNGVNFGTYFWAHQDGQTLLLATK